MFSGYVLCCLRRGISVADHELDLRGVVCPMNFVKTRLFLDKMAVGDLVKVILDAGEPVESVSSSVLAEGHQIEETQQLSEQTFCIKIRKREDAVKS